MLKRLLKKGVKMVKESMSNKVEIMQAKKEIVKEFLNDQNTCELLGFVCIGIGVVGVEFLRLSYRASLK